MTYEALTRHGYHVLVAEDATQALSALARTSHAVDLMLTDVIMPGMNGRELGRQVALHYPATSVLYMSGYADVMADADGVLEPGVAFLAKPFTTSVLLDRVRSALNRRARMES